MHWLTGVLLLFAFLLVIFVLIARKGRELRRSQPLPPPAGTGFLRWNENGKTFELEVHTPFYIGRKSDSNIVVPNTRADYEVCIFTHKERFAFQILDKAGDVFLNNEEILAGYLTDGDVLKISGREFAFRCF